MAIGAMRGTKHKWVPAREVGLDRDWKVCRMCGCVQTPVNIDATTCRGQVRVTLRAGCFSTSTGRKEVRGK